MNQEDKERIKQERIGQLMKYLEESSEQFQNMYLDFNSTYHRIREADSNFQELKFLLSLSKVVLDLYVEKVTELEKELKRKREVLKKSKK